MGTVESKVIASFVFLGMFAYLIATSGMNITGIEGVEKINNTQAPTQIDKGINDFITENNTENVTFNTPVEHKSGNTYDYGFTTASTDGTEGVLVYDVSNIDKITVYSEDFFLFPNDCSIDQTTNYNDGSTDTKGACGVTTTDVSSADEIELSVTDDEDFIYDIEFTKGQKQSIRDYADFVFNLSSENQFISLVIIVPLIVLFTLLTLKIIPTVL